MSELNLVLSERFTAENTSSLRVALGRHLRVGNARSAGRRSIDGPSLIQLLGDVAAWLPLAAPATVFLSTLAKRAAEALWDSTAAWWTKKEVEPLTDVAAALVAAADRAGGTVMIGVGLKIPADPFEVEIWTDSRDPVAVARMLAGFVVRVEKIAETVKAAIERGQKSVGPFLVELEQDGSVTIRWRSASDFKDYEEHVP